MVNMKKQGQYSQFNAQKCIKNAIIKAKNRKKSMRKFGNDFFHIDSK